MPVSIEDIEHVYIQFRKAQADTNDRGYRIPKDFEKHFNEKMNDISKRALTKITGWFLTKWSNIDPYQYFMCGFYLNKTFSYHMFFKQNIIKMYIEKDKHKKRELEITKQGLIKSAMFVKSWMNENGKTFNQYINARDNHLRVAIDHYIRNKIDAAFLVFMMRKGMLLTDDDRSLIPYVHQKYRKIYFGLNDLSDFLKKLEEKL